MARRQVVGFVQAGCGVSQRESCRVLSVARATMQYRAVRVLERLARPRGLPTTFVCDHGPELTGTVLDPWAYQRCVQLHLIRPGKPNENPFLESFNGRMRDECLTAHGCVDLADARAKIDTWRVDSNEVRPHRSLDGRTPTVDAHCGGLSKCVAELGGTSARAAITAPNQEAVDDEIPC